MNENPNPAVEVKLVAAGTYSPCCRGQDSTSVHQILASMPMPMPGQIDAGGVSVSSDGQGILHYAREHDENDGGVVGHRMDVDHDGLMESEGMEGDGPSDPGHPGDPQGMIVPHGGSNQLTLSFQGEVYVFDSVSPEMVQAVLLLLGGREISSSFAAFPSTTDICTKQRSTLPH